MGREPKVPGVLTREESETLANKVFAMIPSGTKAKVSVNSAVSATTSFARGDTHVATETSGVSMTLSWLANDRKSQVSTTRLDDEGLKRLVRVADLAARQWRGEPRESELLGPQEYKTPPKLFFEENLPFMTPDGRAALVREALGATEGAGLVAAGDLVFSRGSRAVLNTEGLFGYSRGTAGVFSLTARTKDNKGSGWAWRGYEDWRRVDPRAVIDTAIGLALRSANPVAVEPGRYTVILEPAAVAEFVRFPWDAELADRGLSAFSKEPVGTNKVGLQVLDRRLQVISDPWDSEAPAPTISAEGEPVDTVTWIKDGVLQRLSYTPWYAEEKNQVAVVVPETLRLFGVGPTQTLEEMIASTKRGIWVNRLDNVGTMNGRTVLLTGTTRDGTFLIENGKITKAIKNLRFTESPFFVLNKLEAFGEPVRALGSTVAPRLKVRDFNFTSLTDAI